MSRLASASEKPMRGRPLSITVLKWLHAIRSRGEGNSLVSARPVIRYRSGREGQRQIYSFLRPRERSRLPGARTAAPTQSPAAVSSCRLPLMLLMLPLATLSSSTSRLAECLRVIAYGFGLGSGPRCEQSNRSPIDVLVAYHNDTSRYVTHCAPSILSLRMREVVIHDMICGNYALCVLEVDAVFP